MATEGLINTAPGAQGMSGALGLNNVPVIGGVLDAFGLGAAPQNTFDPFAHQIQLNAMQNPVAQMMQARAMGKGGPSVAEMQAREGYDTARRAAASAAAGSTNPMLARREALQAAAGLTSQQADQGAILRAQEQQAAQNAYMQQLMQEQAQKVGQNESAIGAAGNVAAGNQQAAEKSQGGLLSAAGGIIGSIFSDKRLKHDIDTKKGTTGIAEFLKATRAARYEYDNPDHGKGPQYGIMAQDAAKTEVGRSFVRETPEGLQLDGTRAIGPILAALAHLDAKIEGK